MLEKRYGGRKKSQWAAKTIQQAYRRYQMNKRYQHLKRTHSVESRISRYLDHHQQLRNTMQEWGMQSNRARVMVIEDNELPEEGQTQPKMVRQLVNELNNSGSSPVKQARSGSTAEQGKDDDDLHRNNSNNASAIPGAPGSKVEGPRLERKGSQTFVVTLTMCKQQDSETESDNITSEPSSQSSPRNTLTRDSTKTKVPVPVRKTDSRSETPTLDKGSKKVITEDSNVVRKLDLGEEIGETDDASPGSEDSQVSAQASISPCDDNEQLAKVVWTESPLFKPDPPDFKAYTASQALTSPPLSVRHLDKDKSGSQQESENNNQLESSQQKGDVSAAGDNISKKTKRKEDDDVRPAPPVRRVSMEMIRQEEEGVMVTKGNEEQHPGDEQGPPTPVGVEFEDKLDRISIASTLTSEYEKDTCQDVPAVTVASPEGSMKILEDMVESTSSSDSDMSDDEPSVTGGRRSKRQQAMQAKYNQQAALANKQFSKVHSNRMESPVWKRKSMDTKSSTPSSRNRIINGTPLGGNMTRSETGDSMSSESSGSSSKFTYEDTSSMADDSVDSLSGDSSLFEGIERHVVPTQAPGTLSIPMTPMRKRRYRIGVNLFNK